MPGELRLEVRCARCGEVFLAQRITRRYCSNACRQMAYLNRHRPPGGGGPVTLADVEQWLWRSTP
jgi:ribosomal protein S27AE